MSRVFVYFCFLHSFANTQTCAHALFLFVSYSFAVSENLDALASMSSGTPARKSETYAGQA